MLVTSNVLIQEYVIDQIMRVMDIPHAVMEMMKQIVVMDIIYVCTFYQKSQPNCIS